MMAMLVSFMEKSSGANVRIMGRNSIDKTKVKIWKLKACPRCGGDVFLDKEFDTWYVQCLQCGYHRELGNISELELQSEYEKRFVSVKKRRHTKK